MLCAAPGTLGVVVRSYREAGECFMEKLSEDFKERQKPVARIIVATGVAVAGFLVMLFRTIRKS